MGGGSLRTEIAHGIDIEFRERVKLTIINFVRIMKVLRRLRKPLPIHIGCSFSIHRPRKQERLSFPANIDPSRQRYLALERRMFMLMIVLSGGFLRRPRSILAHLLSPSSAKNKM